MSSLAEQLAQARQHMSRRDSASRSRPLISPQSDGTHEGRRELLATFIDLMTRLTLHRDLLEREAEYRAKKLMHYRNFKS
jgi:hypothetical protein